MLVPRTENRVEAFAGLHNQGRCILVVFDVSLESLARAESSVQAGFARSNAGPSSIASLARSALSALLECLLGGPGACPCGGVGHPRNTPQTQ